MTINGGFVSGFCALAPRVIISITTVSNVQFTGKNIATIGETHSPIKKFHHRRAPLSQQLNSTVHPSPTSFPSASPVACSRIRPQLPTCPVPRMAFVSHASLFVPATHRSERKSTTTMQPSVHHRTEAIPRNQSLSLCSPFHPPGSGISQPGHRTVMCLPCISVAARVLQLQPGSSGPIGDGDRRDICHCPPPPPGGAAWGPHRGECPRSRQPSEC